MRFVFVELDLEILAILLDDIGEGGGRRVART